MVKIAHLTQSKANQQQITLLQKESSSSQFRVQFFQSGISGTTSTCQVCSWKLGTYQLTQESISSEAQFYEFTLMLTVMLDKLIDTFNLEILKFLWQDYGPKKNLFGLFYRIVTVIWVSGEMIKESLGAKYLVTTAWTMLPKKSHLCLRGMVVL